MRSLARLFDITVPRPPPAGDNDLPQVGGGWLPSYVKKITPDQLADILRYQINTVWQKNLAESGSHQTPQTMVEGQEGQEGQEEQKTGAIIFGSHKNFAKLLNFDKYNKVMKEEDKENFKKLGIDNNAILIFTRGGEAESGEGSSTFPPETVSLHVINNKDDERARKSTYDYIEADNGVSLHVSIMNELECFNEIKELFSGNTLDYIILVRHGVALHSVLLTWHKARHMYKIRNSKLLPTQMIISGPIFKQAWALYVHFKDKEVNLDLTYFCSDLIRTQQSLVTFRCAYEWFMKNNKDLVQLYYGALLECLQTSIIPQLRSIYGHGLDIPLLTEQHTFIQMLEYEGIKGMSAKEQVEFLLRLRPTNKQ